MADYRKSVKENAEDIKRQVMEEIKRGSILVEDQDRAEEVAWWRQRRRRCLKNWGSPAARVAHHGVIPVDKRGWEVSGPQVARRKVQEEDLLAYWRDIRHRISGTLAAVVGGSCS